MVLHLILTLALFSHGGHQKATVRCVIDINIILNIVVKNQLADESIVRAVKKKKVGWTRGGGVLE